MGKVIAWGILIAVLIAAFANPSSSPNNPSPHVITPAAPENPEIKAKRDAEEATFQRHVAAVRKLRASMKNPASFSLEDAILTPEGALCVVYRATNSFNAIVPGQAVVYRGQITTSDSGDQFRTRWNTRCFKKRGEDMKHIRWAL